MFSIRTISILLLVTASSFAFDPNVAPQDTPPEALQPYANADFSTVDYDDCHRLEGAWANYQAAIIKQTHTYNENGGRAGKRTWFNRGVPDGPWSMNTSSRTWYCEKNPVINEDNFEKATPQIYCTDQENSNGLMTNLAVNLSMQNNGQDAKCLALPDVYSLFEVDGAVKKHCGCKNTPPKS